VKRAVKKLKRFGLAVLLLPVCWGVTFGIGHVLSEFQNVPEGSFYFFSGILSYFAFQWIFFRPIRTYVFGHELTHAIATWMSGGKVKHFHVSSKGGHVKVSKSNIFIALAPYIVPLYALLALFVVYSVDHFYPLHAWWTWVLWLLGATLGFHMALTAYALQMDQPDLKTSGKFLSAVVIYLGNTLTIVLLLGILFPRTVSWGGFARCSGQETLDAFKEIGRGTQIVWREAAHVSEK
jgi:hypothetical protein